MWSGGGRSYSNAIHQHNTIGGTGKKGRLRTNAVPLHDNTTGGTGICGRLRTSSVPSFRERTSIFMHKHNTIGSIGKKGRLHIYPVPSQHNTTDGTGKRGRLRTSAVPVFLFTQLYLTTEFAPGGGRLILLW